VKGGRRERGEKMAKPQGVPRGGGGGGIQRSGRGEEGGSNVKRNDDHGRRGD